MKTKTVVQTKQKFLHKIKKDFKVSVKEKWMGPMMRVSYKWTKRTTKLKKFLKNLKQLSEILELLSIQ